MDHYRASHNASTTSELSDFCLLSRLTNLEHLELNTFYLDRDEFHEIFDPASRGEAFRSLKTCKLDHAKSIAIIKEKLLLIHLGVLCFKSFDATEFRFSIFRNLLFHPTLEVLTIFNAAGGLQPFSSDFKSSTALQGLDLLNCEIHPHDVEIFLSVPQELKELIIHTSEKHIPPSGHSLKETGVQKVVGPSLERLVIARDWVRAWVPFRFYGVTALRYPAADMWMWMRCLGNGSGLTHEEAKEVPLPTFEVPQELVRAFRQIVGEPEEEFYHDVFNIMSLLDSSQVADEVVKYRVLRKIFVSSDAELSRPFYYVE